MILMHNPAHPGEVLKKLYLEPLGLTIGQTANGLGVHRSRLSALLNQKSRISPVMALRLAKAFPNTDAQFWLSLQNQFDLWQEKDNPVLATVKPLASAA